MIYKISMSKGDAIFIDEEDLTKIQENIKAPLIRIKNAIINPSFMISITPHEERDFISKPIIEKENGVAKIIGYEEVKKLQDVFTTGKKNDYDGKEKSVAFYNEL